MSEEDNIVEFNGMTKHDLDPNRMLENISKEFNFDEVIVLGFLEETQSENGETDGGEFFLSASRADAPSVLWLLENAKNMLMR